MALRKVEDEINKSLSVNRMLKHSIIHSRNSNETSTITRLGSAKPIEYDVKM
jgi:hypothetical protein